MIECNKEWWVTQLLIEITIGIANLKIAYEYSKKTPRIRFLANERRAHLGYRYQKKILHKVSTLFFVPLKEKDGSESLAVHLVDEKHLDDLVIIIVVVFTLVLMKDCNSALVNCSNLIENVRILQIVL